MALIAANTALGTRYFKPLLHITGRWACVLANQFLHKTDLFQGNVGA
jgi:hypothetical protein